MKTNQKGFSLVEILIVLIVIGLLGAVGWLVYDRQSSKASKNTDTLNTRETTLQKKETPKTEAMKQFTAIGFNLDVNKLPKNWTATINTADVVTLISDGCFIEAIKENDVTLSTAQQAEGIQELLANDKSGSKGYVVTDLGTSTLTVYNSDGAEKVTSYEFLWDLPDDGNPFRYSRAYSVQDNYYVSVRRSCNSEAGFTNTDTAMSALIFKQ